MKKYKVEIRGIRPLLTNKWITEEEAVKKKGEDKDDEAMAKLRAYEVDGKYCIPSEQVERAMEKVASSFKLKGMRSKSYKDLIQGAVFLSPEFLEIKPQQFEIDKRTVVIPSTRGRVMRYRPKWKTGWKAEFIIEVMDDRVTPDILQKVIDEAGRIKGVGDARSIGMGRFMVTKFSTAK